MHSLEQLRRGELAGIRRLDLAADLSEFPEEIFALADSLEVLNLSGNRLRALPHDLSRLHRLKVLFCSDNHFETLPEALGDCPQLEMVGFKSNRIEQVPAAALPARLRWLILTDNRIEALPQALGERPRLQKLMLAGNRLSELPQSLAALHQLELLRIAANRLDALPDWLLQLPRLAWLAFAGNPGSDRAEAAALAHLHGRGILHGDLYAHNLLVDGLDCRLSDFGAASFFTPGSTQGAALQRLESRAFGILLEELLQRCDAPPAGLQQLAEECQQSATHERPDFAAIIGRLQ